ncbi:hypothetical protein MMC20_007944 [Loxospora ochrophaea]|nr:hypothetical protein [Loxospora ochrophaea]
MSRSTNPSSAKRLATEDIKVTLGSRIDGKGHFMNPTSVFAMDPNRLPLSEAIHSPLTSVDEANATPRDHYEEIAEMQHAPARHLLSTGNPSFQSSTGDSPHEDAELGLVGQKLPPCEHLQASRSKPSRLGKLRGWIIPQKSETARTGYWDILSLFRTAGAKSTVQSKTTSGSESG